MNLKFTHVPVLGSYRVYISVKYWLSELGKQIKINSLKTVH